MAYELAQVVYADAQQQTDGAAGAQLADDDVVDADYEVVDDEDKRCPPVKLARRRLPLAPPPLTLRRRT